MLDALNESAAYAVESPIGLIHIVIDAVNRGSAWIDEEVIVNRIPHQVRGVDWQIWDGAIRAGSRYSIRRTDTHYPEDTTWNAYKKITDEIEAAVELVKRAEGPYLQHFGRLAEVRSAKNAHESEANRLRAAAEDYLKKAALEEQAVEHLSLRLTALESGDSTSFDEQVKESYARGEQQATRDISRLDARDDTEAIYSLEREVEQRLREVERLIPVAHITDATNVAYLRGYIETCSATREALRQAENERYYAERRAQAAAS